MASTTLNFQKLSKATSVYEPSELASSIDDGPTTVLILGYLGASERNLFRYSQHYNSLYPTARIILVFSTLADIPSFTINGLSDAFQPLVEIPARVISETRVEGDRLLVHAFSNGGAMSLAKVSKTYLRLTGTVLPARCFIFDSLPGSDRPTSAFGSWVRAISMSLPKNPLLYYPGTFLVILAVIGLLGFPLLLGLENAVSQTRRELNDEEIVNLDARRLYIYSEADDLVKGEDIRAHAADAAAKGWDVETIDFGRKSGHVRHAVVDKERYWNAVWKTWNSSFA